ncbi:MAG TPA: DUF1800 domain-containing protein [Chloroflexota bacterium]|nr:DUF1800 domain-containing protein [Chloroflexota bacterium]
MEDNASTRPRLTTGRRNVLVTAAVAGIGALIASQVASSARTSTAPLTDDVKLQHLLRRTGFGASASELDQYRKLGLNGTVERLLNYETVDNSALETRLNRANFDLSKPLPLEMWWLLRMAYTARPFEEKLTLFWHGLLTSAISKVGRAELMFQQNQFFRQNAMGRFPDILKGVSRDPAMMIWLDLNSNRKGHPNENYARELMELFSLGVGNYSEQDVRESARAFTGWTLRAQRFFYDKRFHDDGQKTFLAHTGNFNGNDIIDIIVQQPASAKFITNKLFSFFVYPNPTDQVLQPFVQTYVTSSYSIKALVQKLLTSDEFYSPRAYRALIKSPTEYLVGIIRGLGLEADGVGLPQVMNLMGQMLFNPPNVAGWPGGPAWLTTGTWLARLNTANRVTTALTGAAPNPFARPNPKAPIQPFDVSSFFKGVTAPAQAVDHVLGLLVDGNVDPAQRQVLIDYVTPPNGTSLANANRVWLAERARGLFYLTLALPEFHLS